MERGGIHLSSWGKKGLITANVFPGGGGGVRTGEPTKGMNHETSNQGAITTWSYLTGVTGYLWECNRLRPDYTGPSR